MPFVEHSTFELPATRDATIWRYLTLPKLLDILENGRLFFSRADLLGDPLEGSYPEQNVDTRLARSLALLPNTPAGRESAIRMTAEVTRANALFPSHVAINCWRQDEHESAAMWKLYASEHEGIAVTSTIERLCASFADCGEQVHVGRVSYVDYASVLIDEGNMFTPFLHKRCSFDYEREIRAVVAFGISTTEEINRVPDQLGIYIPIDLSILLSAIVVSPAAPNWFLDVVSSAVGRTTYKPAVLRSAMSGNAVY